MLYGQPAPTHFLYLARSSKVETVDRSVQTREAALKVIKFYLQIAQNRIKQQADKRRSDRTFEPNDLVYVKLQPYHQTIMVNR